MTAPSDIPAPNVRSLRHKATVILSTLAVVVLAACTPNYDGAVIVKDKWHRAAYWQPVMIGKTISGVYHSETWTFELCAVNSSDCWTADVEQVMYDETEIGTTLDVEDGKP